jgi:hypothetical protein
MVQYLPFMIVRLFLFLTVVTFLFAGRVDGKS